MKSAATSACSAPSAERVPGAGGTRTHAIFISSASRQATTGPAPPKATSMKSRGSMPRRSSTPENSVYIVASATRTIALAVSDDTESQRLRHRPDAARCGSRPAAPSPRSAPG